MKPAAFEYLRPTTIDQTVEAIAKYGSGKAAILAGGQTLVGELKTRSRQPSLVVDVSRVAELHTIERGYGQLRIGAMVSLRRLQCADVGGRLSGLIVASKLCGPDDRRRNRATVGGTLVAARGGEVLIAAAACEDASLALASTAGSRVLGWRDFPCAPGGFITPPELVTHLNVRQGSVDAAAWVAEGRPGASLAGVLTVRRSPDGRHELRLGLAGSAGVARLARAEERLDVRAAPTADEFTAAVGDAVSNALPTSEALYGISISRIVSLFSEGYRAIAHQAAAVVHARGTRTAVYASKRVA
jgi:carbon-monoxide dehydrogenase medium subunit